MNLIVGATGMVGSEVCKLLRAQRRPVRALVRESSNSASIAQLESMGVETVKGDLKDRSSLDQACRDVRAVISTASSTRAPREGDSLESVDELGQLNLVAAAKSAGVDHFVFVSFPPIDLDFPLQSAKRRAEKQIQESAMNYTILQPTCFTEVWLSPALGFDIVNAQARIYGAGKNAISWISFQDVAKFAVAALDSPEMKNAVVRLGGPEALTPLEVVDLAKELVGRRITVEHIPEDVLRTQFESAADPLQKSFAALMLFYAAGSVIQTKESLLPLSAVPMKTVREHLQASLID